MQRDVVLEVNAYNLSSQMFNRAEILLQRPSAFGYILDGS